LSPSIEPAGLRGPGGRDDLDWHPAGMVDAGAERGVGHPQRLEDLLAGVAERRATADRVDGLTGQVAALAERQALTTHDDEHDPEGVTIGFERAQMQGLLTGARNDLSALDRAADRIAAGSYGRCLRCGVPIPAERLDAPTAAETCLVCASRRR
jgi:DnaK suppressor protein